MADLTLSGLARTLKTFFRIGTIRIKDSSGVVQMRNDADSAYATTAVYSLRIQGTNGTNAFVLQTPSGLSGDIALTLPGTAGATGEVLRNNGDGTSSWAAIASNSDLTQVESFTQATSSPLTIFTPPANAIIREVAIEVTTPAGGGSPTISVGVSGTAERDMAAAENDLKTAGVYRVFPLSDVGGSPAAVIATITPNAQTFSGKVYVTYSNPS